MKRFWTGTSVVASDAGWSVALDGKPLRTPARKPLALPTRALAEAIAAEWDAQTGQVRPAAMPLTGLANAALDRAGPELVTMLAAYGESDLLCYRAERPAELIALQAAEWDPPLEWARRRYDVVFVVTHGIAHRVQPAPTLARLTAAVDAPDLFRLAGLNPLITITGSLVLGLAVLEGELTADTAFDAGELDTRFQAAHWGEDAEAAVTCARRRADLLAGARFLAMLD